MKSPSLRLEIFFAIALSLSLNAASPGQVRQPLSAEQRETFEGGLRALQESLDQLHDRPASDVADAAVFQKGLA